MGIKTKPGILPIFIALIVVGSLGVSFGGYEGVRFYQSGKLVKQADQLMREGRYAEAKETFEKAGKKFKPTAKKVANRLSEAADMQKQKENLTSGNENFGKGEWRKCVEYLGQVTAKFPNYGEIQERYSDCQKKLAAAEEAAAKAAADAQATAQATTAQTTNSRASTQAQARSSASRSSSSSPSSNSSSSSPANSSSSQTQARPVLYLPFSMAIMPDGLMPMGETINHPKPQNPTGHPGIDFQWNNPSSIPQITVSMEATVTEIRASSSHSGAWDVATRNGRYEVDYTEMGSVRDGLKVGDTVNVGDVVGTPQHPVNVTDQPNYRMIHWQFGYAPENTDYTFVTTRLCPLTYFASSALSTINSIWANTNWPQMKANAPDICSNDYAG